MKRIKLSVALATFNEEKNLGRCLDSVKNWADEIIIVDGSSTDKTREIARKYGARVIKTTNKPIFHINKQKAIDQCQGEWILQLDADEVVSVELAREIKEVVGASKDQLGKRKINSSKKVLFDRHQKLIEERDGKFGKEGGEIVAFFTPRLNYFLGSFLHHTGVYPDGVIRLFKRGKARLPCKSVHEQMEILGEVGWLENDLLHYADYSFSRYLIRSSRYTTLTAQEILKIGEKPSIFGFLRAAVKTKITFLTLFFRHKGFLDGFPGLVFSWYSGLHHFTSYVKFWEMSRGKRGIDIQKDWE